MREFVNNKWQKRLQQCSLDRVDTVTEYDEGEREYRKRIISKHIENGVHIAQSITKVFWDDHSTTVYRMLLIDEVHHVVP